MKMHTLGEYECTICQIRFTQRALTSHKKRYHPDLRKNELFVKLRKLDILEKVN